VVLLDLAHNFFANGQDYWMLLVRRLNFILHVVSAQQIARAELLALHGGRMRRALERSAIEESPGINQETLGVYRRLDEYSRPIFQGASKQVSANEVGG
jgi:hypothetical protein